MVLWYGPRKPIYLYWVKYGDDGDIFVNVIMTCSTAWTNSRCFLLEEWSSEVLWFKVDQKVANSCCCRSVAQSCPTLCDPMACSTPGFPVLLYPPEFAQMFIEWMMLSNHLILSHPLLLPSIFPSIRVFSNELTLRIRWPNYYSW